MQKNGTLYLLPNLLAEDSSFECFPKNLKEVILQLQGCFVESEKGGRRFLNNFLSKEEISLISIKQLNEHTKQEDYPSLLQPLLKGEMWGIVSDAGLPCIADPGSELVFMAKSRGIDVKAIFFPSSPILALLLSGLPAQRFAFNGYLPRDIEELQNKIKLLEKRSATEKSTQIWMETPYRFKKMTEMLIKTLKAETLLCIAEELSTKNEKVITKEVYKWRENPIEDRDSRAIFLIYSEEKVWSRRR